MLFIKVEELFDIENLNLVLNLIEFSPNFSPCRVPNVVLEGSWRLAFILRLPTGTGKRNIKPTLTTTANDVCI